MPGKYFQHDHPAVFDSVLEFWVLKMKHLFSTKLMWLKINFIIHTSGSDGVSGL